MNIIFGETNTDGTGSASNLTTENGHEFDIENVTLDTSNPFQHVAIQEIDDIALKYTQDYFGYATTYITNNGEWNADGAKEVSVEYLGSNSNDAINIVANDSMVKIENFVDVNIDLEGQMQSDDYYDYSGEFWLQLYNAKRADIDVSDFNANTIIKISTQSNGVLGEWSNMFDIQGSDTNSDYVYIEGTSENNAQYTEFNVALNNGNDRFNSTLTPKASTDQIRFVDGGEGDDIIEIYGDSSDIEFVNFESIYLDVDSTLTLNEDVLQNNTDGLVIQSYWRPMDIEFSDEYNSITIEQQYFQSGDETGYLDVTVSYDDADYHLLVQDTGQDWSL
ncbi:hypothetical protein SAMN04488136_1712 [Vibrio xiamenensis]|uniref:Uncharacterized protein n=1 Tax=Vibrio xiamenensis TaxID=861298 RepID=A0A1G8HZ72_9VIBR|nr:hypothetical protein [Vibrio xiamenensis]SDI11979.1 hypothetical protein SAMN04488136_1712 [Vibrio xiamenensis]